MPTLAKVALLVAAVVVAMALRTDDQK